MIKDIADAENNLRDLRDAALKANPDWETEKQYDDVLEWIGDEDTRADEAKDEGREEGRDEADDELQRELDEVTTDMEIADDNVETYATAVDEALEATTLEEVKEILEQAKKDIK